jgi:hypothetical protein
VVREYGDNNPRGTQSRKHSKNQQGYLSDSDLAETLGRCVMLWIEERRRLAIYSIVTRFSYPLVPGEREVPGQERYLITPNTRGFGSTDP